MYSPASCKTLYYIPPCTQIAEGKSPQEAGATHDHALPRDASTYTFPAPPVAAQMNGVDNALSFHVHKNAYLAFASEWDCFQAMKYVTCIIGEKLTLILPVDQPLFKTFVGDLERII